MWHHRGITKVMEPVGLSLVMLLVKPALSLEIHRYKLNKNKKINIICLKPNEQAVEIILLLFYYLLERLFNMQACFFRELPQCDLKSPR